MSIINENVDVFIYDINCVEFTNSDQYNKNCNIFLKNK